MASRDDFVMGEPRGLGSRQACSLMLLTAVLIGSCVALAVRTLLESGSGMLLLLVVLGFMASMFSVVLTVTRRHLQARREQGLTTACCGCIVLSPIEPWETQPTAACEGGIGGGSRAGSSTHREQVELSRLSALSALPEQPFVPCGDSEEPAECSLCMEALVEGEMVREMPCGHTFKSKCIDRWLLEGQAHQRRRCPLCNADPVETVAITCPQGVRPGDQIRVHHNADYDVTVPFGVQPGQVFHTNLPAMHTRNSRGESRPSRLPCRLFAMYPSLWQRPGPCHPHPQARIMPTRRPLFQRRRPDRMTSGKVTSRREVSRRILRRRWRWRSMSEARAVWSLADCLRER